MVVNLIGLGSHGKNVALFQKFDKNNTTFIKEAFQTNSNLIIEKEHQGFEWYFRKILKRKNPVLIRKDYFYKLIMPSFAGNQFQSERKFHIYQDVMLKIVKFYIDNWVLDEHLSVHGDMALCNFFVDKNEIYLIDWEHYHTTDLKYYGFDIINMLFISFYYRLSKGGYAYDSSLHFIRECVRLLYRNTSLKNEIIDRPFYNSKRYLINNHYLFSIKDFEIKRKFVLASYPDEILNKVDLFITK